MAKIHLIGNAHLDPVWLWRWQEGFSEILATYRSALDRMNEFPDYKFTSACAVYYQWIEKMDKDMFDEICMRIKGADGALRAVGFYNRTAIFRREKALQDTVLYLKDILKKNSE